MKKSVQMISSGMFTDTREQRLTVTAVERAGSSKEQLQWKLNIWENPIIRDAYRGDGKEINL